MRLLRLAQRIFLIDIRLHGAALQNVKKLYRTVKQILSARDVIKERGSCEKKRTLA